MWCAPRPFWALTCISIEYYYLSVTEGKVHVEHYYMYAEIRKCDDTAGKARAQAGDLRMRSTRCSSTRSMRIELTQMLAAQPQAAFNQAPQLGQVLRVCKMWTSISLPLGS